MSTIRRLFLKWENSRNISSKPIYRIEDMDLAKQTLKVVLIGTRIAMDCSVSDMFSEKVVVRGLNSIEACQAGVACGYIGSKKAANDKEIRGGNAFKRGGYRLSLLKEERGKLRYVDNQLDKTYLEDPLSIVLNEHSIKNISSEQTFYIGFLAGKKYKKLKQQQPNSDFLNKYKYNKCFMLLK